MQLAALSTVRNRIQVGTPLPFNVRNADATLLLARGQLVQNEIQLQALIARGALVDMAELVSVRQRIMSAPREQLPRLWAQCMDRVSDTLMRSPDEGFIEALDEAAQPVLSLVRRDPDLAIFNILQHNGNADVAYGARRSLHSAITAWLVAQRLAWDAADAEKAFKVALTMNLSMLELQGQLRRQQMPPTPAQHQALNTHPMRSVQMLQQAGIADADWLQAVLDHHEVEDGSGYPGGRREVGDLASLARRADVYTSKLSARSYRAALGADIAGRQMFMQDPGHPMTAALVKEFGIYPPGCHVRLAGGELAIVVQRGPTVTTPVVACLTGAGGRPLPAPRRVDTSDSRHAVIGLASERMAPTPMPLERLLAVLQA